MKVFWFEGAFLGRFFLVHLGSRSNEFKSFAVPLSIMRFFRDDIDCVVSSFGISLIFA
jgi:hypothetical protein